MNNINLINIISASLMPDMQVSSHKLEDLGFEKRLELSNQIKAFFDFAYYLGGCPFRLVCKRNGEKFYSKSEWNPQKIVCATLNLLCLMLLVSKIREKLPNSEALRYSTSYFELVLTFCAFFYKAITMKRFWCNSEQFLKVANAVLLEKYLPLKTNIWINRPRFLYAVYGFYFVKILVTLGGGYGFMVSISRWSPIWWFRRLIGQARFVFCFWPPPKPDVAPMLESITSCDVFFGILMIFANYARYVFGELCDIVFLVFALTLWVPANSFACDVTSRLEDLGETVKSNTEEEKIVYPLRVCHEDNMENENSHWNQIYKHFQAIENLSEVINNAMGTLITWFLAEGLLYYSINMNTLFVAKDLFNKLIKFCFFVITFLNLYISADICYEMEAVKTWLVRKHNFRSVPTEEAYLVLHEIITKDIGIRGNNTFTITFPLATGYLSLIVTFFIICVQESDVFKE